MMTPFTQTRDAYSLIELTLATFLMGLALIPAMSFITEAITTGRELETWNTMNLLAMGKLEQQLALSASELSEGTSSGNFTSLGYSDLKFVVDRSWQTSDGGIDSELLVITATVWQDDDNDAVLDSGEKSVVFATKLSKLSLYGA